jgi:Tfp pilus assembly protein PilN
MSRFDLNLSTRPFKPYRATNLGLLVLLLLLIAISARQVYNYQQYSQKAAASRERENDARAKADQLAIDLQALNKKMASGNASSKLSEVEQLNQLIVRKSFSWTRLFRDLERLIPDDVRLLSLHPAVDEKGQMLLNLDIRGRSLADATAFLRALEQSRLFNDVVLAVEEKKDPLPMGEVEFVLSAYYYPEQRAAK